MAHWKEILNHMAADAEGAMDQLRYRMHYALGGPGPIKIITYRGYGTQKGLYLMGRVLEDRRISEATKNDDLWNNLLNMYKRLESNEVPHARLIARFQGVEKEVVADEEGFFEIFIKPQRSLAPHRLWHPIEIELKHPIPSLQRRYPVRAMGQVLVPPETARYVVISDIDDTVMQTDATHLLRMARNVFLGNAHTRLPFPGVAALYRALFSGRTGTEMNPLFYVSSSPWNLYDLLSQFFNLNSIPVGPVLFLRDWGLTREEVLPIHNYKHKMVLIQQMLDFYPHLPFILIGDSGQEDPEIYSEVVKRHPKRVLAVYIRNVSRDIQRPEAIRALAKQVIEAGSSLVLADDSLAIGKHAAELGLINPASLSSIHIEKKKDEQPPTPIEKMLGEDTKIEPPTVEIQGGQAQKQQAVKSGAVENVVKEAGRDQTSRPPTVVVEGDKKKKGNK